MTNTDQAETKFVQFINANSEKVKALAALKAMPESEKLELVKQFKAALAAK
jgi:hypothetical protein